MSLPSCLTLRTVKGSVLSWVELDNNFICLNNSINNVASLIHNGNMWHIPSGSTVTIETDYQHFIYGDMVIEGTLQLSGGSQLVVLNGDLIFSGGTVVGDGDIYNISLPEFDTKISGLTYSGDTLTIYQNDGSTYSTTIVNSTDITITGGTYNPTTGTATFYDNNGGNFDVNGFLTGFTDVKVSGLTYSGDTLTLTQTDGSNFNVTINSSTPFTGNTSGDCITDLYVTNLNSCSPLHIQPVNTGDVYISENGGNVGIGTTSPTAKLDIKSPNDFIGSYGINWFNSGSTRALNIDNDGSLYLNGRQTINWGNNYSFTAFDIYAQTSQILNVQGGGSGTICIGPGVADSDTKLHIKGLDSSSSNYGLKVQNSGGTDNLVVRNDGVINGNGLGGNSFELGSSSPYIEGDLTVGRVERDSNTVFSIYGANYPQLKFDSLYTTKTTLTSGAGGQYLLLRDTTNPKFTWLSSTNIGINFPTSASTITNELEVNGKTSTTTIQITSGATTDYILTSSDSQGNGVWTPSYNLSSKDYGSFYDTTTQIGGNGTIKSFQLNSSGATKGISITDLTGITVTHTGVYNIQFSAQLKNDGGTKHTVFIWLMKNGLDIPNTNTGIELGNNNTKFVAAWNFVEEFNSNDVINLMWYSPLTDVSTDVSILYDATPTAGPEIPSLILTITQI